MEQTTGRKRRRPSLGTILRKAINYLLYIDLAAIAGTALLLEFRLPPGSQGGHGLTVLGLDRHGWGDVHFWLGVAFGVLVLVHLYLGRNWILRVANRGNRRVLAASLGIGLLIAAGPLLLPVGGEGNRGGGGNRSGNRMESRVVREGQESWAPVADFLRDFPEAP